ncbi:MAG TPA: DUF2905 domain-containing protein [Thermosulfurimonas dismutans]|uniref:DUF2905 domain-containing protein n=1 Tax=Thermosulfurimonas dismutans TaxID=999894 RepID=A0A7C3GUW4_9BACT|nr:DUF2905 domain-containing protein [Thermosulfurimonas sp.]HFC97844.1 DUF2905 domain-containing protein [Thermosulfurimonas dismutans]
MNPLAEMGKMLILFGIFLILAGALTLFLPKLSQLPRLPGDILIRKGNFTFYFPLVTCLILSLLLTLILNILRR